MTDTKASLGGSAASVVGRKRLAEEARKLAMECLEGTAPEMGVHGEFYGNGEPCCAAGHVLARAGGGPRTGLRDFLKTEDRQMWWVVGAANDNASGHADREARLVFPLLALADALEDAAEPQKSIP